MCVIIVSFSDTRKLFIECGVEFDYSWQMQTFDYYLWLLHINSYRNQTVVGHGKEQVLRYWREPSESKASLLTVVNK